MSLQLGDTAPDFAADSTAGRFRLYEWMEDGWAILFSHPKDFTPVCTTELGQLARMRDAFAERDVKVASLSVDGRADHERWSLDIERTQGVAPNFPLIADPDGAIARLYGMIHPRVDPLVTVRSVFVIGPDKRVKLTLTYPASTGRNFDELLRVVDSLQLTANREVATPADWSPGDDVIILPAVSNDEAGRRYPDGWRELAPYLRFVPQPEDRARN